MALGDSTGSIGYRVHCQGVVTLRYLGSPPPPPFVYLGTGPPVDSHQDNDVKSSISSILGFSGSYPNI